MHEGQEIFELEDEDDPDADCLFSYEGLLEIEISDIYFRLIWIYYTF